MRAVSCGPFRMAPDEHAVMMGMIWLPLGLISMRLVSTTSNRHMQPGAGWRDESPPFNSPSPADCEGPD